MTDPGAVWLSASSATKGEAYALYHDTTFWIFPDYGGAAAATLPDDSPTDKGEEP